MAATRSALAQLDRAPVWLNSEPLTADRLHGRVVLVDFWTDSCVNWLRTLPYVRAWAEGYADLGLVVVGAHAPEFGFEHDLDNVRRAAGDLGVGYPVVIDNDFAIWQSFGNRYWPAVYLVDRDGRVRFRHFGEEAYEDTERAIQQLPGRRRRARAGGCRRPRRGRRLRHPEVPRDLRRRRARRAPRRRPCPPAGAQRVGARGPVDGRRGVRGPRRGRRIDRLPLRCARPQPGLGAGGRWWRRAVRGPARRRAARRRPRARRRRGGRGRPRRATDVPARASARARPPVDLRDQVPRSGPARVRVHV